MPTAGRPRRSSRATIEDAAAELFLEQGFAGTTIDQITQRAGVSRATFFNYFAQKSDLLWVEVDAAIGELRSECGTGDSLAVLRDTLTEIASRVDVGRVPLALSQGELLGSTDDVLASGLTRVAALTRVFERSTDRTRAYLLAAAVSAAWIDWARAGVAREPLERYLGASLDTVFGGLA